MNSNNSLAQKQDDLYENEELFTGENDEEVLNCEGGPCNFVYKEKAE